MCRHHRQQGTSRRPANDLNNSADNIDNRRTSCCLTVAPEFPVQDRLINELRGDLKNKDNEYVKVRMRLRHETA